MTTYTQTSTASDIDVGGYPTGTEIVGENCSTVDSVFYDLQITDAQFYLGNPGSNAGTCTCGVFSGTTLKHTFWTKDISTLPTGYVLTSETSTPTTTAIAVDDYIGIASTGYIKLYTSDSDNFDGVNSQLTRGGTIISLKDAAFSITVGEAPPPASSGQLLPPPVAWI